LLGFGSRGFYRDLPRNFLGDFFSHKLRHYLRGFVSLLLNVLPQRKEKHENDEHNYDQDEGGYQRYNAATHVSCASFLDGFPGASFSMFIVEERN
jgi:hypothetical protein